MKLRIIQPGKPDQMVNVDGDRVVIGRSPDCDVSVNHPYVSSRHAEVYRGVFVADLGSRNGTFVHDERISSPTALNDEGVRLGTEVRVEVIESLPSASNAEEMLHLRSERDDLRAKVLDLNSDIERLQERLRKLAARAPQTVVLPGETPERQPSPAAPEPPSVAPEPPAEAAAPPAAADKGEDDFAKLLRELRGGPSAAPAAAGPAPRRAEAGVAPTPAAARSGAERAPAPQPVTAAPQAAPPQRAIADLLNLALTHGGDAPVPWSSAPADQFLVAETFVLLQRIEKIVSAFAGHFSDLLQVDSETISLGSSFRRLCAELLLRPDDPGLRSDLVQHFAKLRKYLWVALHASPQGASLFCDELRKKLSEEYLTREDPIGGFLKNKDAELWRRASEVLEAYTPGVVEDRLEALRRASAETLLQRAEEDTDALGRESAVPNRKGF